MGNSANKSHNDSITHNYVKKIRSWQCEWNFGHWADSIEIKVKDCKYLPLQKSKHLQCQAIFSLILNVALVTSIISTNKCWNQTWITWPYLSLFPHCLFCSVELSSCSAAEATCRMQNTKAMLNAKSTFTQKI